METHISFDWPGQPGRLRSVAVAARRDLNGWAWDALLLERGRVLAELHGRSASEEDIVADCKRMLASTDGEGVMPG